MAYKKENTPLVKYGLWAVGAFILLQVYKAYNAGKLIVNSIGDNINVTGIQTVLNQNGLSGVRADAVTKISEEIYEAFYKQDPFGWFEDEDKAVAAFNSCLSVAEAVAVASIYKVNYNGKSLYKDFTNFLNAVSYNDNSFKDLKTSFVNAIKSI